MNIIDSGELSLFHIRRMEIPDIQKVLEIDQSSFPNPWSKNAYEYEINQNLNSRPWVGIVNENEKEKILAFAVFWNILDEVHIGTFAVHTGYRNLRIGSYFLGKLLSISKNEGMVRALLEVRESNSFAIRLYESFGFQIDGIRKKYYRDNRENAILMSASLLENKRLDEFT